MVCVVSVTGIKHAAPVEAELGDAVDDVISRSMLVGFFRSLFYLLGVPAFAELFNRAHIDEAIVQMVAERGHVLHQKHLIHVDGVSCKRAFTFIGVFLDEVDHSLFTFPLADFTV